MAGHDTGIHRPGTPWIQPGDRFALCAWGQYAQLLFPPPSHQRSGQLVAAISRRTACNTGLHVWLSVCIKADLLKKCDLTFLSTKGYSFQSSLLLALILNNARVIEVPIVFPDRKKGESKLRFSDQVEFLLNIFKIRFRKSEEYIKTRLF